MEKKGWQKPLINQKVVKLTGNLTILINVCVRPWTSCLFNARWGRKVVRTCSSVKTSQRNIFQNKVCKGFPGKLPSVWLNHRGRTGLLLWMSVPDLSGNWVNYASNSGTRSCSWIPGQAKQTRHGDEWKSGEQLSFHVRPNFGVGARPLGLCSSVEPRGSALNSLIDGTTSTQDKGAFPVFKC